MSNMHNTSQNTVTVRRVHVQVNHHGNPTTDPEGLVPVEWAMYHGMWVLPSSTRKAYPRLEVPIKGLQNNHMQVTRRCRQVLGHDYEATQGAAVELESQQKNTGMTEKVKYPRQELQLPCTCACNQSHTNTICIIDCY